jgi:hypothetical protein
MCAMIEKICQGMKKKKPLALVTYRCLNCGADYQKYFELYEKLPMRGKNPYYPMKFCAHCKMFGYHDKILPDDDHIKHYRRPDLFF